MDGGGGGNFFEEVVNTVADVGVNYMTMGLAGYEDGKIKKGVVTRGVDEAVGELTGRNMQRDVLDQQRSSVQAAKQEEEVERQNALGRRRDRDVMASRAAAISRRRGSLGLGGDGLEADVLGV